MLKIQTHIKAMDKIDAIYIESQYSANAPHLAHLFNELKFRRGPGEWSAEAKKWVYRFRLEVPGTMKKREWMLGY